MAKKKILFVAHMDSHIANFHLPYLKWFQDNGYETHVASNDLEKTTELKYTDFKHQIPFERSPFTIKKIKVYREFKKLINEHNFEIIHAHTPMGGLITRLAYRKKNNPVFYTAHGFHFLKGGSIKSWLLFYPIEKYLSKLTKELITINEEDYLLAKKKFSKKANITLINGVGVNANDYKKTSLIEQNKLKEELSLKDSDIILTYIGEHTKGKNHQFLINAMKVLTINYPNLKLLLLGYGKELENNKKLINKLNLNNNIKILGFRNDINNVLSITNILTSSSNREGLAKALLEGLVSGKPMIVSDVRGNRELVQENYNGFKYQLNDQEEFITKLTIMLEDKKLLNEFSENSFEKSKDYLIETVLEEMTNLYKKYL